MSTPFIGEIQMFAGNFAPRGYALCNGQLLQISTNTPLFSLLGTTYGGNGVTNFALPDLRGRVPIHEGQGPGLSSYILGQSAGSEAVTLTAAQMPAHNHTIQANDNTTGIAASGAAGYLNTKTESGESVAASGLSAPVTLNGATVNNSGGNQPHTNIQPYLVINFIIALEGIYPSRN